METDQIQHFLEIDFRYDWLSTILKALETRLDDISEKVETIPWFDGGFAVEHAESIYGITFVSAQTYILGATQDVNKIRQASGNEAITKIIYYSDDPYSINNQLSRISLINSIANYYKHQDEWLEWPNNYTTKDLARVGILQDTEFPCYKVALKLWQENDIGKLRNLLPIVSSWRKHILRKYKPA